MSDTVLAAVEIGGWGRASCSALGYVYAWMVEKCVFIHAVISMYIFLADIHLANINWDLSVHQVLCCVSLSHQLCKRTNRERWPGFTGRCSLRQRKKKAKVTLILTSTP